MVGDAGRGIPKQVAPEFCTPFKHRPSLFHLAIYSFSLNFVRSGPSRQYILGAWYGLNGGSVADREYEAPGNGYGVLPRMIWIAE